MPPLVALPRRFAAIGYCYYIFTPLSRRRCRQVYAIATAYATRYAEYGRPLYAITLTLRHCRHYAEDATLAALIDAAAAIIDAAAILADDAG